VKLLLDTHAAAVADLPFHHRDPFDRLLVAQCLALDMSLYVSPRFWIKDT